MIKLCVTVQADVNLMDIEEFIVEEKVCHKDAQDPLELLDRHAMNVTNLNNLRDDVVVEGECIIYV